jgi:hypothetical protein
LRKPGKLITRHEWQFTIVKYTTTNVAGDAKYKVVMSEDTELLKFAKTAFARISSLTINIARGHSISEHEQRSAGRLSSELNHASVAVDSLAGRFSNEEYRPDLQGFFDDLRESVGDLERLCSVCGLEHVWFVYNDPFLLTNYV